MCEQESVRQNFHHQKWDPGLPQSCGGCLRPAAETSFIVILSSSVESLVYTDAVGFGRVALLGLLGQLLSADKASSGQAVGEADQKRLRHAAHAEGGHVVFVVRAAVQ